MTLVPAFEIPEKPLAFGHGLRPFFHFPKGHVELNHGSFGTYPNAIHDVLLHYRYEAEKRPDYFNRQGFKEPLDASRAAIASLLNVPTNECVFVPNATTGVNTILRSLTFNKNDAIISFSTIYAACGKTVAYICDTTPAESYVVNLRYPMKGNEILQGFREVVKKARSDGKNIRIAVFDVVSSLPGVRMPFERLAEECKKEGIMSMVDGAHGVGHVKLDLKKLDADFFVSNAHKWLFVPRACAVLHVPLRNQHLVITSLPTSHYYIPKSTPATPFNAPLGGGPPGGKSNFIEQFEFNGTIDASQYYCVAHAIRWRQSILGGEDAILSYTHTLNRRGGEILAKVLGTEVMTVDNDTCENGASNFTTIRLPIDPTGMTQKERSDVDSYLLSVWYEFDTFIPCITHERQWWARVASQVYNQEEDYVFAGKVIKEVCERIKDGRYKKGLNVVAKL